MDIIQGIFSGYHTEIVSVFYRGYSGYQTGNIVVIIRGIWWLSYKKCVVIMQRIDRHNNIVSSLLSEVFLAQFKLNHKQPSVLNNPHFPVTLRRITNTYDSHHIPRMITTVCPV